MLAIPKNVRPVTENGFSMKKNGHRTSPVTLLVPIPSLYLYLSSRDTRKSNFPAKISGFTHETVMRAFDALNKIFPGLQETGSLFGTETLSPSVVQWELFFGKG